MTSQKESSKLMRYSRLYGKQLFEQEISQSRLLPKKDSGNNFSFLVFIMKMTRNEASFLLVY